MSQSNLPKMMGYTIVAAAIYLVGLITTIFLPGNILGLLADIGLAALLISIFYYGFRLFGWIKRRLFWKVRNKLIVSFAFVGIIPLIILILISTFVLVIVFKRLSGVYLELELSSISEVLETAGQETQLAHLTASDGSLEAVTEHCRRGLALVPFTLESSTAHIFRREDGGFHLVRSVSRSDEPRTPPFRVLPEWLDSEFSGLASRGDRLSFVSTVALNDDYQVVLELPFDQEVVEYLHRRTSIEIVVTHSNPVDRPDQFQQAYEILDAQGNLLTISWVHFFTPALWESGEADPASWTILLRVPARILLQNFFAQSAGPLVVVIVALMVTFVLVLCLSLVIGAAIARNITQSVHDIYSAVENIRSGNFHFRIPTRRADQLDEMAESFNEMSQSIVHLMDQVSEREWLEKELEIAREVQNQLFPQTLPELPGLEIAASCHAARQVSGDYYDFLQHGEDKLDIVVGDISGKGISAALLMASIQSAIRGGLADPAKNSSQLERMRRVVQDVNLQLYRRSSPESFSTLVLSQFDRAAKRLYYCNAGHHPPLIFSGDEVRSLTAGGTVVGLFEKWNFEAGESSLNPGDLLVLYTDGVIEATNSAGEQFGSKRLRESIRSNLFLTAEDIQNLVLDQVFDWSGGKEQEDDITVVCLKILEQQSG